MRIRYFAVLAGALVAASACNMDKYLAVNTNPNAPQSVTANLYLPPMEHWLITSPQYDGRYVGRYTQMFMQPGTATATVPTSWDREGYDRLSDAGAEQWRDVYWSLGPNLTDMLTKAQAEKRWDLLGVGQTLRAWGWQVLVDLHGPIIIKEAFDPTRSQFDYDTEQYAYQVIDSLLNEAIKNLSLPDTAGAINPVYLAAGDQLYHGDRTKWLKFAYGLRAISRNHFSNKSTYDPATVVKYVDSSFTSNADDALFTYPDKDPGFADYNFLGQSRNNVTPFRQTNFALNLMNGTDFGVVDPRLTRMLAPSPDGVYRGTDPNNPQGGAFTAATAPNNFFGKATTDRTLPSGRYVFDDNAKVPNMTYAELQFVKAEAAYRMGDKNTALTAYKNGISAHIDFVSARVAENRDTSEHPISATEKTSFMGNIAIVPIDPNALTLTQIMTQKYIALWGWGFNEAWMDMRRYHYTDLDPMTGTQVYPGFTKPTNLDPDNNGNFAQRIRPRYNSEYVWNQYGLGKITPVSGLNPAYHTQPLWVTCASDNCQPF